MASNKCVYCNQPGVRLTKHLLCMYHYALEKPWGSIDRKELANYKKCSICGDIGKTVKHHVNYYFFVCNNNT